MGSNQVAAAGSALIVDDSDDMRELVRTVLENSGDDWTIVGEIDNGAAALHAWRATRPDVVIVDQRMPGMTGLELAERILHESPRQSVLLFSAHLSAAVRTRAEALGLCGIVDKNDYARLPNVLRDCLAKP